MSPGLRKFLITMMVVAFGVIIISTVIRGRPAPKAAPTAPPSDATAERSTSADGGTSAGETAQQPSPEPAVVAPPVGPTPQPTAAAFVARVPSGGTPVSPTSPPAALGSLDPTRHRFEIQFAPNAAGIASIVFSDLWINASARNQANQHERDPAVPMPPNGDRYVLSKTIPVVEWTQTGGTRTFHVPILGTHSVEINGAPVSLFGNVWNEIAPGRFATEVADSAGSPVLEIERAFEIGAGFDVALRQTIRNVSGAPVNVRWVQYGPSELEYDPTAYVDARRMQFGYLLPTDRDPAQTSVIASGQLFERSAVSSIIEQPTPELWPNADAIGGRYTLSWFASKNRYFCIAVHAPWTAANPTLSLASCVDRVRVRGNGAAAADLAVLSELYSPVKSIAPGQSVSLDMGVFAGPLDRQMLGHDEPYQALGMDQAVVYMLSSCCSFCTFAWLANFMSWFLTLLHNYLVFDWGLAIIVLVILVRLALHPLMKRSQIQMQRFGRQMAELKPELDAIQKRHAGDTQKIQAEQMRLYREKGINPVGCVGGILPTFLQMPIWIALYAMLFFAWDLRQAPAFFGVFQLFGGWSFLADLSRPDNFFVLPRKIDLWLFTLTSINLLPLLMGVVFFLQQKYMTPPTPNLTPEQEQQQKIMKVMMVVMFPLMLYIAPSGLTLYILTSTCIGIWESKMVKRHIDAHGLAAPAKGTGPKRQDRLGKLYEDMLERARRKQAENKRTFKERG